VSVALTLLHLSDTHLAARDDSPRARAARAGWTHATDAMRAAHADLVVHTGDVVHDDPDDRQDRAHAVDLVRALPVETRVVPGNHDVGDHAERPGLPAEWAGPVHDATRRDAWCRSWGPDFWSVDRAGWRVVGLNSFLLGSGTPAEAEQERWLGRTLATARRPTVLAMHEPLMVDGPDEPDTWATPPGPVRRRLARLIEGSPVALVLSGHLHRHRTTRRASRTHVSAPSTAFPVPHHPRLWQPRGDSRPGLLRHRLHTDGTVHTEHIVFETARR
jgi:3',5'-cyclic AMP phosphodiesterase CpdA